MSVSFRTHSSSSLVSTSARRVTVVLSGLLVGLGVGCGSESDAHEHAAHGEAEPMPMPEISPDARVFFVAPADGATVVGPLVDGKVAVRVEMGAENLRVMRAGELADGAGHHHIIIDGDPVPREEAVPANPTHIHYGLGQTEAELQLEPGPHTLRLQFADGAHRSYGSALSTVIHVNVSPTTGAAPEAAPAPAEAEPAAEAPAE